jgi:hypothetical protein
MNANPVTKEEFDRIKTLLTSGVPAKMVSDLFKRGEFTISIINKSDDFAAYQTRRKAYNAKKPEKPQKVAAEPTPQKVTVVAERFLMEEVKKQTELLTTISAKLAFIVDELTK